MKRIYLYFKERIEKGEFTSRGIQVLFFWGLGLFSTIWFLVRVIPETFPCQLSMYADSGTADVCICHVLTLIHGSLGESA